MFVLSSFQQLSQFHKPIAWAIGVFDGLHLGHQAVIESAGRSALENQALCGVLTFDKHPLSLVRPEAAPTRILGEAEKWETLEALGVDLVLNLPFDQELAELSPERFFELLCDFCSVVSVSVGQDWHFGKNRAGNITTLADYGKRWDFDVHIVAPVMIDGLRVSSTSIRQALSEGDVNEAQRLLGRDIILTGEIIKGRQLARQLDFPTANMAVPANMPLSHGVYVVQALVDDEWKGGVANLGVRPTVEKGAAPVLLETHLFDFDDDLYGSVLAVKLLAKLRGEKTFESIDALGQQLHLDAKEAKEWLVRHKK